MITIERSVRSGCGGGVLDSSGVAAVFNNHRAGTTGRERLQMSRLQKNTQSCLRCATAVAALVFSLGAYPNLAWAQCEIELLASDGAQYDSFGQSVSVSGDTAVIGAPFDDDNGSSSGSAYVFRTNGSSWTEVQKLVPSGGEPYDGFGYSVAVDGDIVVVGAPDANDNDWDSGSAYVFRKSGSTWIEEKKLLPSDGAYLDHFGGAVAISGNTIIVGAFNGGNSGFQDGNGAVYVYSFDGTSWGREQKLVAFDGEPLDLFGNSVAISGDVIVVGAERDDDRGSQSGSAYVFRKSGSSWVLEQKLLASDGAAYDYLAQSVAVSGNLIVVGAPKHDDTGVNHGSAYLFRFDGTSWIEATELYGSDSETNDKFAFSVSVGDDVIVVGAPNVDKTNSSTTDGHGAVYVFRNSGATWVEEHKLSAIDGAPYEAYGYSVAVSGDVIIGGALGHTHTAYGAGAAYVLELQCAATEPECSLDSECRDADACTVDTCEAGMCANTLVVCDDGNACTVGSCDAVDGCVFDAIDCDDGNTCTFDYCSNGSCQHANNTNLCNDGNACTTDDRCSNGTCSGTLMDCDDGNICTSDFCSNGNCVNTNNTSSCDDGDVCTERDRCWNGSCSGAQIDCDDGNPCTEDFCSNGSCQHTNNTDFCTDGNACTVSDRCSNGTCSGTLMDCDDGNLCTNDFCMNGSCEYTNNTNFCADGNACTVGDRCSNGSCSGTLMDCNDNNPCTSDFCSNGSCVNTNNTSFCNDGNACTTNDRCSNGSCSGTLMDCDDGISCTIDSCMNGVCNYDPASCPCLDNSDCDDANPCTTDTCDPIEGCVNEPVSNCCGNGSCEVAEDPCNCPDDCGAPPFSESDCTDGLDNDCDARVDCDDGDCITDPACGLSDVCNHDGVCGPGEDCDTCSDCLSSDGAACGNGICEAGNGEDCGTCPTDCNGKQNGRPADRFCCGGGASGAVNPVGCDDTRCNEGRFACTERFVTDSCCGDGVCEGIETGCNCPVDCGPPAAREDIGSMCRDGLDNDCDGAADCDDRDCAADRSCPSCDNDTICEPGEDCRNCPKDCSSVRRGRQRTRYCCGNGILEEAEGSGGICDGNP